MTVNIVYVTFDSPVQRDGDDDKDDQDDAEDDVDDIDCETKGEIFHPTSPVTR